MSDGYTRLYHRFAAEFPAIYANDAAMATWTRLLMLADASWPLRPPLPRSVKPKPLAALVDAGLLTVHGETYSIRGLDAERNRRSNAGRNAAAVRWQSERNADPMPRRDEHRRDETRRADPGARDGLPNLGHDAVKVLEDATGQPWSQAGEKQLSEYDRLVGTHGVRAVASAFAKVSNGKPMTARQLVWPALRILEPFPNLSVVEKNGSDERESQRVQRNLERTKRDIHATGFHQDAPDPACPACREAGVTA